MSQQPITEASSKRPTSTHAPWWQTAVVYEVYIRSFQDSNADGVGDLRGIEQRLPYLHELGVDALWITPFYPSPLADFGYDVSDYMGIDPSFGTMADFDRLVQSAHDLNIRIVIDMVLNHTSDEHRWFQESRSSRTNPKRDWYIWAMPDRTVRPRTTGRHSLAGARGRGMQPPASTIYISSLINNPISIGAIPKSFTP